MANTYTLIDKSILGSSQSSVSITSIPSTYTDLKLVISARTSAEMTYAIGFNSNTSSYSGISLRGSGSAVASYSTTAYSYGSTAIGLGYINNVTSTFTNCEVYIPNYTSSNNKSLSADNVQEQNVGNPVYANLTAGLWSNSAAITSIQIKPESGTFETGSSFYLYGIKNS
jgi:hypothetical protein